jgi:hypothetical protein
MQIFVSLVGGFLLASVIFYPQIENAQNDRFSTQLSLDNCQSQLQLSEAKLSGMLMNK